MAAKRSYVVDENGNRTAVMLPIEEYEELLEDLQDLAVIAQRRDEPTEPQLEEKSTWSWSSWKRSGDAEGLVTVFSAGHRRDVYR